MQDLNNETPHAPAHAAPPAADAGSAMPEPTMPEPTPRKKHRIYDNRILTVVFNIILFFVVTNLLSMVVILVGLFLDMMDIITITVPEGQTASSQLNLVASVVTIFVGLWIQLFAYERRVKGEQKSVVVWSSLGMLLVLPSLAFVVLNLMGLTGDDIASMNPILPCLIMAMAPGIAEEAMFRGTSGSNWMRVRGEARDILPGCLVTSIAFGLVHGVNALAGAALSSTAFQIFYAFCLGMFFDAVLLRSGSILPTMILHTLIDFSAFLFTDMSHVGLITEELTIDTGFFVTLIASIVLLGLSLYMLRPAKHDEIVALWNDKCYRS